MSMLLARFWLFIWRWQAVEPAEPVPAHCVMIAAPHTTNWDFPLTLALAKVSGVPVSWLGKRTLFKGPMGPIMRRLGGVAIDRSAPGGMVASLANEFSVRDQLALLVPAEGTRSRTEYWKSGFYRIAEQAQVPIVLAFVDRHTHRRFRPRHHRLWRHRCRHGSHSCVLRGQGRPQSRSFRPHPPQGGVGGRARHLIAVRRRRAQARNRPRPDRRRSTRHSPAPAGPTG